jgi:gluconolactonase
MRSFRGSAASFAAAVCIAASLSWFAALQAGEPPGLVHMETFKIEGIVAFVEGPAWHADGNVYFSDPGNNRIMRRDRGGSMHVFRQPSGNANGLLFDHEGRLMACEGPRQGGNLRVTRTEHDGTIAVLADLYNGKRFNGPNDLAIDSRGRVYFTDPRYGDRRGIEQFDEAGREIEGVYRIDPDGKVTRVIAHEVDRPNGILVSPGDKYLFVADNVNDGPNNGVGGARKLWRFDLAPDGSVVASSRELLFDWGTERGPDGMAQDTSGRLYVAAGFNFPNPPAETADKHKAGVYIITYEGRLEGFIPVPEDMCTNCTFGGPDLKTLYITAGHKLFSVRLNTTGFLAWPKLK